MFKLAILLFSFALESLAYDDTVRCNFTFPDSGLKNGRNQEINDELIFLKKRKFCKWNLMCLITKRLKKVWKTLESD